MKKAITAILLMAGLMLLLAACGGSNEESGSGNAPTNGGGNETTIAAQEEATQEPEAEPEMLNVGDTAVTDQAEFTITDVWFDSAIANYSGSTRIGVHADRQQTHTKIGIRYDLANAGRVDIPRKVEIVVDYNDGFLFDTTFMDAMGFIGALDSRENSTVRAEVPNAVSDNTDAPLRIRAYLPSTDGRVPFYFVVR
jgi:hypothetical protein